MGSNDRRDRCYGILCNHRATDPWNLVNDVLIISASLIGGFIFAALLSEDVDDDDHFDGGMMQPLQVPSSNPV